MVRGTIVPCLRLNSISSISCIPLPRMRTESWRLLPGPLLTRLRFWAYSADLQ